MILAAGLGSRMRPLTDSTPKPLLTAAGKPLLQYHIESLATAGLTDIVVNTGPMGEQIEARFGAGRDLGVRLSYSHEGDRPLETGGGILRALPLLGPGPFVIVNGDIWTDYDFSALPASPEADAHLVLVDNPAHHPHGDFALESGRVSEDGPARLTYAGIAVLRPALFAAALAGAFPLAPLLTAAMRTGRVSGELYRGAWLDVGTPGRLRELEQLLPRPPQA